MAGAGERFADNKIPPVRDGIDKAINDTAEAVQTACKTRDGQNALHFAQALDLLVRSAISMRLNELT